MPHVYNNPGWIDPRLLTERKLDDVPSSFFDEINDGLSRLQSDDPLVSVTIPAFNEEVNILKTLYSLSRNKTTYPVEIIVVNNNSSDRTQEVLDRLKVRSVHQPNPGWGPARQRGQESARGKYILSADADCVYPPDWIQRMTDALVKPGVSCVYGGYSFLAPAGESRLKYFIYESLKNVIVHIRDLKRPWFNCGGASMGYVKEFSLKIGFIQRKIRGEDGRMCYELSHWGKIVRVSNATVWTSPRTLYREGSLLRSFVNRVNVESRRLLSYFEREPEHDTHASENFKRPAPLIDERNAIPQDPVTIADQKE